MAQPDEEWQRFKVLKVLGRGSFGETLLVEDYKKHGNKVVIKVPHDDETEHALITELINLATLTANLKSHPNIVRYIDHAKFKNRHVMIMEFVLGRDLRGIIGPIAIQKRPMDLSRALEIFEQVCTGLVAAHRVGLVHRDIKPENILIRDEDGVAKLADFGISTIVMGTTQGSVIGTIAGTAPYMAPEAFRGKGEYESDLWSTAVMLYEMVTGGVPFMADNLFDLKSKIENEDPVPPSKINPKVHAGLDALILKGLAKNPRERFRTAQDVVDALVPSLDEPITAARALFNGGQEDEAERTLQELLRKHPNAAKVYMALAEFFNRRQQYLQAEGIVRTGVARCPSSAGLHFYLAPMLWNQGGDKRRQALVALERALELGLAGAQAQQARILLRKWKETGQPS